jgi:hypothetical protein
MGRGNDGCPMTGARTHGSRVSVSAKVAGDAHADRTDTAAAHLLVNMASECAQPVRYRARPIFGEYMEFAVNAKFQELGYPVERRRLYPDGAEHPRHEHGEACVHDAPGEPRHLGGDPGTSCMTSTAGPPPFRYTVRSRSR